MYDMDAILDGDAPRIEYLNGRAYAKVSPRTRHAIVQGALDRILHRCGEGTGIAGPELRCYPGGLPKRHTSFVPDVAFVSFERLADLPSAEEREKPPFSPDVAVEIRSPSDDLRFLAEKISLYLATGSVLVLDVDPNRRTVHAYASDGVRHFAAGERFMHPAAAWLELDVNEVFRDLDPLGL